MYYVHAMHCCFSFTFLRLFHFKCIHALHFQEHAYAKKASKKVGCPAKVYVIKAAVFEDDKYQV
jgi:hypothetical protein